MEQICSDCPRACQAQRTGSAGGGVCVSPMLPRVIRAAPHYGEEPCISGTRGAGTIFFSGCNLRCVFCQNREISRKSVGRILTVSELRTLMLRLRDQGVHNIELVTPTHFTRVIAEALDGLELGIPVVWNSSGYEKAETLRLLEGLVQVYMPDLKYLNSDTAKRYSAAADYPEVATAAISDVIDYVADSFSPGTVLFSLMSQYTPMPGLEARFPELCRTVTAEENENLIHYLHARRLQDGFWQELSSVGEENIPIFDGSGLDF